MPASAGEVGDRVLPARAPAATSAGWSRRVARALRELARRRALSIALVALVATAGSAATAIVGGVPAPAIPDEFSFLLAADTFLHGRLANRPHPLWEHFESFNVIQQPTYSSKYPPAQGAVLAVGQMIGLPVIGVWLSAGLACGALYWMLLGWMPPAWAMAGGWLAVVYFGIATYWSHTYWGGFIALTGGALVLGAFRRLVRRPRARDAVVLGLGLALIATSRPYEGLLMSLAPLAALLMWMVGRQGPPARVSATSIVVPLTIVLGLTIAGMAYYNHRIAGDALRMPYQVHEDTYSGTPLFLFQRLGPEKQYRHPAIRDLRVGFERKLYQKQHSLRGFARGAWDKVKRLSRFYVGPAFLLPILMLPWVLRDRFMLVPLACCLLVTLGLLAEVFYHQHYAAPVAAAVLILAVQGMRHLRLLRWRQLAVGRALVWVVPALALVSLAAGVIEYARTQRAAPWNVQRAALLRQLTRADGEHLVIVRYAPTHWRGQEWVYNEADIDRAKVVWAREMDPEHDRALLEYFRGRRAWLLEADAKPRRLVPYPAGR